MSRSRERSQRVEDEEHNSELREPHTIRTILSKPRTLGMAPILVSSSIGHKRHRVFFFDNSQIALSLGSSGAEQANQVPCIYRT
jgi:hypothetical protein